jgi:hypothetical protein
MTPQDKITILTEIKKLNPKLNEWEKQFMIDMENKRFISAKQEKCLLNIYEKATGGGIYQNRQYGRRW